MTVGKVTEQSGIGGNASCLANQDLGAILDVAEDGIAVFDRNERLVHCNSRFRAMFAKIDPILVPGTDMTALARASVAAGYGLRLGDEPPRSRAGETRFIPRTRAPQERQLVDGRWFWMKDQVNPDGGSVIFRRDVSNRVAIDMRLNLALDAANQGIWDWYPATWTLFFNREWRNTLGYGPDDNVLFHRNWRDFVHPEDRDRTIALVEQVFAGQLESLELQYRFARADGSWAWIQTRARRAERDPETGRARRIVGLHVDISRERESEIAVQEALDRARRAEDRLWSAIETLPQGFILFDADRRLIFANAAYMRQNPGLAAEMKTGMLVEEVAAIANRLGLITEPPRAVLENYASLDPTIAQSDLPHEVQAPDGRWFSFFRQRTRDGGYAGMRTDITERRQQEIALREALTQAEAANLAKTQFLANMSHELRTPLNAILGFSEIMREAMMGPLSGTYRDYAADIHVSGSHLLEIINDILDLSKLTLWSFDLHEELLDPRKLVESCMTLIRPLIEQSGLSLIEEIPPQMPLIRADATRIKQVLLNLLSNAKKYSRPGGEIAVRVHADATGLAFVVADSGIGMEPADIPKALEAFRQVGDFNAHRQEGTGLGLPLAKAMVEAHGGSLAIDSAIGCGTTVTVRLPPDRVVWDHAPAP